MQKITPRFLSLGMQDVLKGFVVAIGSAVFALVSESVEKGQFTFDYTPIWHTAVAAGVAYLGKQFFTPSKLVTTIQ